MEAFEDQNYDIVADEDEDDNEPFCDGCGETRFVTMDHETRCNNCDMVIYREVYEDKVTEGMQNPGTFLWSEIRNSAVITGGRGNHRAKKSAQWNMLTSKAIRTKKINDKSILALKAAMDVLAGHKINIHNWEMTLMLFNYVVDIKGRRDPIKTGIIAKLFYYVNKDHHMLYSDKDLCKIFNTTVSAISKGSRVINQICQDYPEFDALIQKSPITSDDIIDKIVYQFPETMSTGDIRELRLLMRRAQFNVEKLRNTSRAVVCGIFYLYVIRNGKHEITKKLICEKMSISASSIDKYKKYFSYLVYNRQKYVKSSNLGVTSAN